MAKVFSAAKKQAMATTGVRSGITTGAFGVGAFFTQQGPAMIAGFVGITTVSMFLYYRTYKKVTRDRIEIRSSMNAITPLLLAERDREFLKQVRKNRDDEAKLMANVEGWETGTYYGEPIYKTLPPDTFLHPNIKEYYVHAKGSEMDKRTDVTLWD